jgi:prepilin-type N-terminal cleavage/methylation domain-containing protein
MRVATSQACKFRFNQGFGLLEVLIAAVVLGFLLIGLNTLQKGNRESILRVRARDAASAIAQDVIDSISALGSASAKARAGVCPAASNANTDDLCRWREFKGDAGNVEIAYVVNVNVKEPTPEQKAIAETEYSKATGMAVTHQFAKQIDVTVGWKFKNAPQSISVSSVIR